MPVCTKEVIGNLGRRVAANLKDLLNEGFNCRAYLAGIGAGCTK
jgi:hypothetical protein